MAKKKTETSKTKMTRQQAQRLHALIVKKQWLDKRKEAIARAEETVAEELEALFNEVKPANKTLCSGVEIVRNDKAVYDKAVVYDHVLQRQELWGGLLKINSAGLPAVMPLIIAEVNKPESQLEVNAIFDLDTRAVTSSICATDKQGKNNALGLPSEGVETVNTVRITKNALKTGQELFDTLDIVEGAE